MKKLIQLEYLAQWFGAYGLSLWLGYPAWWFWAWLLVPDLSMVGYLVNAKIGAWCYNVGHHLLTAFLLAALGLGLDNDHLLFAGILLWGHIGMDRVFGYGLKFERGFKFTHLGKIGPEKDPVELL